MLISQGSFRVCKNIYQSYHNVILLILLTLLEKLVTLLNLLKKSTTNKNFTWARAQVCHVHPTPMDASDHIYSNVSLHCEVPEWTRTLSQSTSTRILYSVNISIFVSDIELILVDVFVRIYILYQINQREFISYSYN